VTYLDLLFTVSASGSIKWRGTIRFIWF